MGEYFNKSFIFYVPTFEFPIRHLYIDLFAKIITSAFTDEIKHLNKILLTTFSEVGCLQPKDMNFTSFKYWEDALIYFDEGIIINIKTVINYF